MKNKLPYIAFENNTPVLTRGKYKNKSYLSYFTRLRRDNANRLSPVDSCQNFVRIPEAVRMELKDRYFTILNPENGLFADVIADDTPAAVPGRIQITNFIAKLLEAGPDTEFVICRQNYFSFSSIRIQTMDNIKEDVIVLPENEMLKGFLGDFSLFEVVNLLTNDSIYVRSVHIMTDPTLKANEIRMNKKQRNMLSDNIPSRLSDAQYNGLADEGDIIRNALEAAYKKDGGGYTIIKSIEELDYDVRSVLHKYIRLSLGERLLVRPVPEAFRYEKKKSILRKITEFFVGKSSLSLNCRRPHECDENADIVRMSANNMLLLGVEPMDKVIVRFRENEVSCHVLPFCEEKYGYTNTPGVIELSLGIPAHVRNKLKIYDIQSSVKVDRDTEFIFRKSMGNQLIPIILTLLSLKFFEHISWYFSLLLLVILIPVVMYITLSNERNMRGK